MSDIQDIASGSAFVSGSGTLIWSAFAVSTVAHPAVGTYDFTLINAISDSEYDLQAQVRSNFALSGSAVVQFQDQLHVRVRTEINGSPADIDFTLDIARKRTGGVAIPAPVPAAAPSPDGLTTDETIYVSPTGSDANDGTIASPVLTPRRAMDLAASNWRKANTIEFAAGQYAWEPVATYGGSPFGGRASPLLFKASTRTSALGTRTVDGFTSTPATDLQDTTLGTLIPAGATGTISNPSGSIFRVTDPALVNTLAAEEADLLAGRTVMWAVFTGNSSGNNGEFTATAVSSAAGTVDYRNAQGVAADANNGFIRSQRSYVGSILRMITGINADQKRDIGDHGCPAGGISRGLSTSAAGTVQGALNVVAVASLVNNDNFMLTDAVGNARTFEYQAAGGFVPVPGRTTINVSALADPSAAGVAVATAAGINGVLPSVVAVRASRNVSGDAGVTAQVVVEQMIPGSAGNVAITEAVANAGFTVIGFVGGVGAPRNTFRVALPFGSNPSNGDTFAVEQRNVTFNYGAAVTTTLFANGVWGFRDICWNNAGASPGTNVFIIDADAYFFTEGVEWRANGGSLRLNNNGLLSAGSVFLAAIWGNQVPNPFFPLPANPFASTFSGCGWFLHDISATPVLGANFGCFSGVMRQAAVTIGGFTGICNLVYVDAKRTTVTIFNGLLNLAAQGNWYSRLKEQQAVSATTGILNASNAAGAAGRLAIAQALISGSGGHGTFFDGGQGTIALAVGVGNVGVGIRAISGSQVRVTTAGLGISGAAGAIQVGNRAARSYANFTGTPPTNNEFDVSGDGSRIGTAAVGQNFSETRTGVITVLGGVAFADITFGAGFGAGVPAVATLNTVNGAATQVISAVWQAGTVLRVTVNAVPVVTDVAVSATATVAQT